MLGIPRRYTYFVFGVIQSGLTSLIAAGIASIQSFPAGNFLQNWLSSWLMAWMQALGCAREALRTRQAGSTALSASPRKR